MQRNQFLVSSIVGTLVAAAGNTFAMPPDILQPFYLPPAPPLEPGPGGLDIRTWVRSTQTNNQFSCIEAAVAPKTMGPPPHLHKALDEICYVLEGTASVLVGDKIYEVQAGGFHLRPRGLVHTFWNASDKPLRFMDLYFNQNFEEYLEELFHQIYADMAKQNLTPLDPTIAKRMAALDKRFGVTMFPEQRQAIVDKYGLK
ncbi:cupin domain-containing protein [Runella sp. MFBS21]|uniref:cupin domain-containing protein n=1 Tax=Runella sp. MFBS21 TaxID=3034018 RepID=UPI0023F940DA|nr:cupin domain-containing protein [Runella sp. MFBS21]MDF7817011.1 cupin domain-containing protein [Runella sp. MFBS21]